MTAQALKVMATRAAWRGPVRSTGIVASRVGAVMRPPNVTSELAQKVSWRREQRGGARASEHQYAAGIAVLGVAVFVAQVVAVLRARHAQRKPRARQDGTLEFHLFENPRCGVAVLQRRGVVHGPANLHHARQNGMPGKMALEPGIVFGHQDLEFALAGTRVFGEDRGQAVHAREANSCCKRDCSILPMSLSGSVSGKRHLRGNSTGS